MFQDCIQAKWKWYRGVKASDHKGYSSEKKDVSGEGNVLVHCGTQSWIEKKETVSQKSPFSYK